MNSCLIFETIHEKLTSIARMLFIGLLLMLPCIKAYGGWSLAFGADNVLFYSMVLGAGIIGADVSSGVLQLVFARPIRRSTYVISRWAGLVMAVLMVYVLQLLLAAAIMLAKGHEIGYPQFGIDVVSALIIAFSVSSVMVFLSSVFDGYGDIRVYILLFMLKYVFDLLEKMDYWPAVTGVSAIFMKGFIYPIFEPGIVLRGMPLGWLQLVPSIAAIAVPLAFAIHAMNRKEISYGGA